MMIQVEIEGKAHSDYNDRCCSVGPGGWLRAELEQGGGEPGVQVQVHRCTVYSVQVMTPVFRPGPEQDLAQQYGEPSCLLWWETSDFIQLGFVATSAGHVLAVNLVTATLVSRHVSTHT